jgi:hypothetical protein
VGDFCQRAGRCEHAVEPRQCFGSERHAQGRSPWRWELPICGRPHLHGLGRPGGDNDAATTAQESCQIPQGAPQPIQ